MRQVQRVLALTCVLLTLTTAASASTAEKSTHPEVDTLQGRVRGTVVQGGFAFKNLPYAAPPVGPNRWRPPLSPAKWTDIRDASTFGPSCAQEAMGWNNEDAARGSEDCLTLNIWTPGTSSSAKLPVMVWIHGGAFAGGSGGNDFSDGAKLMRHGVVIVTINYRLGVLGFLAHPTLAQESPDGATGNYGYMDQLAALRWVYDNIAKFGGDPTNVTAFGQSAGAIAISALSSSNQSRGLFHRAILESGSAFGVGMTRPRAESEALGKQFGDIPQLRTLPVTELIKRWQAFEAQDPEKRRAWPTVDGELFREEPAQALLKGAGRDVAILIGTNTREFPLPSQPEVLKAAVERSFGDASNKALEYYLPGGQPRLADPVLGDAGEQLSADIMYRCGALIASRAARTAWLYQFDQALPGMPHTGHSHEVIYVLGNGAPEWLLKKPLSSADWALSDEIQTYWTNFARSGNPNGKNLARWPQYTSNDDPYLAIAAANTRAETHLRSEICPLYVSQWSKPTP